jgi:hypothetical protein
MSSNRLMYDTCAYKKNITESVYSGNYALYAGKYQHCAKCRIELGQNSGRESSRDGWGVSVPTGNLVDLESDLRGQTRQNTHCQTKKFQPNCKPDSKCQSGLPCGCDQPNMKNKDSCNIVKYRKRTQVALPKLKTRKH